MIKHISSLQNPFIKNVLLLQEKARERRLQHKAVVEGLREIMLLATTDLQIEQLIFCPDFVAENEAVAFGEKYGGELLSVSSEVFEKITYRGAAAQYVAVVRTVIPTLRQLSLPPAALVLVLEALEKPGNIGAILRSADAVGADAVLLCDIAGDLYNPNLIRASLGSVFTVPLAVCSSVEAIDFCRQQQLRIYATHLEAAEWYHQQDYTAACALVMGSEAWGISTLWQEAAARIKIPQKGIVDSMNVSVAAAIMLYEAARQRGFG